MTRIPAFFCGFLLALVALPPTAFGVSGAAFCAQLYSRKYYIPASRCFLKEAQKIPYSDKMPEVARLRKGSFLREAARNLDRAAAKESKLALAAYHRELAVSYLQRALKLGLVRKQAGKRRGRLMRVMMQSIRKKIGYAPLAVSTLNRKATIEVSGFKFKQKSLYKFNRPLRPGTYTVKVKYPSEKRLRTKTVVLKPNTPSVLSFVEAPPVPATAWVGYTVGGAAFVTGVTLLVVGIVTALPYWTCPNDPRCTVVQKKPTAQNPVPLVCRKGVNENLPECKLLTCGNGDAQCKAEASQIANPLRVDEVNDYINPATLPFWIAGGASTAVGITLLAIAIASHINARRKMFQDQRKQGSVVPHPPKAARWAKIPQGEVFHLIP